MAWRWPTKRPWASRPRTSRPPDGSFEHTDRGVWLGGPLAVDDLAVVSVSAALLAAADLAVARGHRRPAVGLSAEHAALSFRSERHALVRGDPAGAGFAPLSRIVHCAGGGWARTHANYPHHAAALRRALGVEDVAGLERVAAGLDAVVLEDAVVGAGGCAAALRSVGEWAASSPGRTASRGTRPAPHAAPPLRPGGSPSHPAAGVRVLDLTRVIAGPVAGRTLAALGADVLRVDPPDLPELPEAHLDTGPGKRTAFLDLGDAARREALLAGADVALLGYRPGALARFGLDPAALTERHPHLVAVSLSAWGAEGPWGERRGFDSLVQVATGIAAELAGPDGTPGVLPAQALDHATGHLMAAAALRGLTARARGEPIAPSRASLAATAVSLLGLPRPSHTEPREPDPARFRVTFGDISLIAPPGTLDGVPLAWPFGPRPLGGDPPEWELRLLA